MSKDSIAMSNIARVDTDKVISVVCFDKKAHKINVTKDYVRDDVVFRSEDYNFSLETLPVDLALELSAAIVKVTECVNYGE